MFFPSFRPTLCNPLRTFHYHVKGLTKSSPLSSFLANLIHLISPSILWATALGSCHFLTLLQLLHFLFSQEQLIYCNLIPHPLLLLPLCEWFALLAFEVPLTSKKNQLLGVPVHRTVAWATSRGRLAFDPTPAWPGLA